MVQSGLEDSELVYVSHYKLAIHFILAMGIICYALWFALQLLVPKEKIIVDSGIRKTWIIIIIHNTDWRNGVWIIPSHGKH